MTKDTVQFMDTVEQIPRYVAMSGWKQASAPAKVMTDLKDPMLVALFRLNITHLSGSGPDTVNTTDWITMGVVNTPMIDDID